MQPSWLSVHSACNVFHGQAFDVWFEASGAQNLGKKSRASRFVHRETIWRARASFAATEWGKKDGLDPGQPTLEVLNVYLEAL